MDYPILIITATDKTQSVDSLIKNIRNDIREDQDIEEYEGYKLYIHQISTKYFKTKIAFLPIGSIDSLINLNDLIQDKIEGIILHFESSDRTILKLLPLYKKFIQDHRIGFSILLCNQLLEDSNEGVTFDCIKSIYNKFDVIELETKDHEDGALFGYDEFRQALESFKIPNENLKDDEDPVDLDDDFDKFENLLTKVMQFRPNTINMTREDRLDYAQNIAEAFEKLILQDTKDNELPIE